MDDKFKIFCAVHLILIKDGKILLQRRNNPNKHGYGMLGMPAGHLEANENVYDAYFFTCEYTGEIKNMEEENAKSLEWLDVNSDIDKFMPYQKYALTKYLESKDNKFTTFGW